MSVDLIDKRREADRVCGIALPNGTWFKVLAIPGMDKLINTQLTNDPLDVTAAKAKKMADLIEPWTPPDGWCNGNDKEWHAKMKGYLIEFFRTCNGFRSQ